MDRKHRRSQVHEALLADPFVTDRDLASKLSVSVQTIRLDRLALGIPEMRVRALDVAERAYGSARLLTAHQVFGELVDLEPGEQAISRISTSRELAFSGTDEVQGHFLYAQAETLALAVVDIEGAKIALARVKFRRGVQVGETLIAKAQVIRRSLGRQVVLALVRAGGDEVFRGKFEVLGEGA